MSNFHVVFTDSPRIFLLRVASSLMVTSYNTVVTENETLRLKQSEAMSVPDILIKRSKQHHRGTPFSVLTLFATTNSSDQIIIGFSFRFIDMHVISYSYFHIQALEAYLRLNSTSQAANYRRSCSFFLFFFIFAPLCIKQNNRV